MDGQDEMSPVTADDTAAFLLDNPGIDGTEEEQEDQLPAADSPDELDTEDAETEDDGPDDGEEEDPAAQPDPTSGRKFKVTVKGDDGADLETEVGEKELIAGYQRHSDYTRKAQALAQREEQAVEVVRSRLSEAQNQYIQQTQMAHAVAARLAGLRTPEEMLQLSQSDPAMYVAEKARMEQVQATIAGLQNRWQQEQFQQQQAQGAEMQKAFSRCWGVIGQKGIDKPRLESIFATVSKDYGVPSDRFATLNDPALVLIMNDAVKYRELLQKKAEVTKKAGAAPRLPQKQSAARNETQEKRVTERLRSGKGSRDDLASFIARNNL